MTLLKLMPFKEAGLSIQDYKDIKAFNLKKCKGVCNLCNQKFNKYLYIIPKIKSQNITHQNSMMVCRFCYQISNFSGLHINNYVIAYSEIKQEQIIARTINFIRENQKVPPIEKIDSDAYQVNLSISEFFDITRNYENLKGELANIKIFVDYNMDLGFMGYKKEVFGFTEESLEEFDEYNKKEQVFDNLPLKKFNNDTLKFLSKHFNERTEEDYIKKTLTELKKTKYTINNKIKQIKQFSK